MADFRPFLWDSSAWFAPLAAEQAGGADDGREQQQQQQQQEHAASLKMPDFNGNTVLTEPGFLPDSVRPIALASFEQYEICMGETRAEWSYLSPPAILTPGQRSGHYGLGSDVLLTDAKGASQISMEDFAVALIDEAEKPRHTGKRFTVARME